MNVLFYATCEYENALNLLAKDPSVNVVYSFFKSSSDNFINDVKFSKSPLFLSSNFDIVFWSPASIVRSYLHKIEYGSNGNELNFFSFIYSFKMDFLEAFHKYEKACNAPLVISTHPFIWQDPLGLNGYKFRESPKEFALKLNLFWMELSRNYKNLFVYDSEMSFNSILELGHTESFSFTHLTNSEKVRDLTLKNFSKLFGLLREKEFKKWICLDLDNTLWNGTLRDDGFEGLVLDWRRMDRFVHLMKRGFVFWIVSKNDPEDTESIKEFIANSHFNRDVSSLFLKSIVGWSVSWKRKDLVISEVSKKLGLSLDHCIFIDDSPHERAVVSSSLKEVSVISEKDFDVLMANQDSLFETIPNGLYTEESSKKADLYKINFEREELKVESHSIEDFNKNTNLEIICQKSDAFTKSRFLELCFKTNRQNLKLREFSKEDISYMHESSNYNCFIFEARDDLGSYGKISCMIVDRDSFEVLLFCLSCRLMKRLAEKEIFNQISTYLGQSLKLNPIRTVKNKSFLDSCIEDLSWEKDEDYFTHKSSSADLGISFRFRF